jgi:hypothetical protein
MDCALVMQVDRSLEKLNVNITYKVVRSRTVFRLK